MAFKPIEILINAKDNASSVFDKLKSKAGLLASALVAYFGVNSFVGVVKGAAEFEAALSGVQAATGASAEEMAQLKKAAEGLEDFGGAEAALALENLGKAGLSAADAIAALGPSANLAKAGQIGLGQASEALTQVIFGLGLSFTESARVADVLAAGANATKTSVAGLTQALSYAAPVANSLGMSLESTVALLGQFAQGGIDASRAGTALNSIMSQFLDPASKFRAELAAAGITTGNFEKALHELGAAGPAAAKAINAVGLESGPALRAALNLGMGALDGLVIKLKSAEGEAARTAAVMRDNLNGSVSSLGKAWEYLTNTLGTPVLPVLKDAVDQLAAAFRSAVADGTVAKFGESIAVAFQAGIKWVREFVGAIDFTQVAADFRAFADQAGAAFQAIGERATAAGNVVITAYGVMASGANTVMAGIYAIGASYAEASVRIVDFAAKASDALAKIAIGEAKVELQKQAEDMRGVLVGLSAVRDEFIRKTNQSLEATARSAQIARDGFAGLAGTVEKSVPAARSAAQAFDDMGKALEQARFKTLEAQKATDAKRVSDTAAAGAIKQLRAEYEAAVNSKNWQAAADVQERLNKALRDTGKTAKEVAEAVDGAFRTLGLKTTEALDTAASNATRAWETIRKGGVTSAEALREAFLAYANAAIEAAQRQGEAAVRATRSLLDSKAAAAGLRLEVTDSGNVIVRTMREAADATRGAGDAARYASGGYQAMGQSAEAAAAQVKKLQEIYDRNKVGDGSDKIGKSGDVREAAVMETDINQDIVKRYGADMVDSDLTRKAWQLRQQLESYQRNYGAGRSQQSLEQQRNIAAELERIEALIDAQRVAAEREKAASRSAMAATPSTPRASGSSSGTGSSGVPSGGGIGAGQTPVNMTINLNGRPTQVKTDADGAVALQGLLGALSNGKGTSR